MITEFIKEHKKLCIIIAIAIIIIILIIISITPSKKVEDTSSTSSEEIHEDGIYNMEENPSSEEPDLTRFNKI